MNRRTPYAVLIASVVCLRSTPAIAGIMITGPTTHVPSLVVLPDGDFVRLNPDPVTYLGTGTQTLRNRLEAEFSGFTFTYHDEGLSGTLNINRYVATSVGPHTGGAVFEARYTRVATDPLLINLRYIQLVDTNDPLNGPPGPYIDPRPNDDDLPFYYKTSEDFISRSDGDNALGGDKGSGTYRFWDRSIRACRDHPDFITWRGDLMLASFIDDGVNKHVDVYDGIRWGWDFTCVPEPSSLVLAVIGVIGIGAHRAARKGRHSRGLGGNDRAHDASANYSGLCSDCTREPEHRPPPTPPL